MAARLPVRVSVAVALTCVLLCGSLQTAYAESSLTCEDRTIGSAKVLLCKDQKEGAWTFRDVGTIAAIVISMLSLGYGLKKDSRARRQSIDDDYWLRKVIGPIAIEPLTKDILEIATMLPEDCCSNNYDQAALKSYMETHQQKLQQHISAVYCLAVVDDKLCESIVESTNAIEDALLEYCANNAAGKRKANKSALMSKDDTKRRIIEALKGIFGAMRDYQTKHL